MNDSAGVGLRERKRAQTAAAIHGAAIELVNEVGLDAATVDAISRRADVSTRTFFNYFPSKEDAILGIDEVAVSAEIDKVRDAGGDPLVATFDLIYALFEASGGSHSNRELKRSIARQYPQLMTRQMIRVAELEDRLTLIIADWLSVDARFADDDEATRLDEARVMLGICLSTVRVSMRKWATQSDGDPGTTSADTDPQRTYERAIETLRTVMEKLA